MRVCLDLLFKTVTCKLKIWKAYSKKSIKQDIYWIYPWQYSMWDANTNLMQSHPEKRGAYCLGSSLWWLTWRRICLPCRRPGFDPWVRKIPWRREWQPTLVFSPGKSHGRRSLTGYSLWGHKSWTRLSCYTTTLIIEKWDHGHHRSAVGQCGTVVLKKEFIGPGHHLRPVHADRARPPLQWTLDCVFSVYGNSNRRVRPPLDWGTLRTVSRLLLS